MADTASYVSRLIQNALAGFTVSYTHLVIDMYIPFSIGVAAHQIRNDVLRLATGKGCGGMRVKMADRLQAAPLDKLGNTGFLCDFGKAPGCEILQVGVQQGIKGGIPETLSLIHI